VRGKGESPKPEEIVEKAQGREAGQGKPEEKRLEGR